MDLDTAADELYGLRPEDFTAARDARAAEARRAGDRSLAAEIGRLRRPSLSAWASNLLVREQPEKTQPLLRLGEGLRQAQRDLDGAQLRELSRGQHALINALARQARQLAARAGHPISDEAQHEVETTLYAVLADPDAAREWATGRLVKPFSPAVGFPDAAPEAARPAPTAPKASARRAAARDGKADKEQRRRLEQARREAEDADRELKTRQEEAAATKQEADDAKEQAAELEERMRRLTEELSRLKEEQRQARTAVRKTRERAREADRRVRETRRRAETTAARAGAPSPSRPGP